MLRFLKFLILAPIALLLVVFGVANRQLVTLIIDPVGLPGLPQQVTVPLFVLFFASVAIGILIGYVASWLAGGKHRRAERELRRECDRLSGECARLKADAPQPTGFLSQR